MNDDDKMLKININLIINKHFKIIGVNDSLKNQLNMVFYGK